jgi:mRNA interferase MazF
VKSSLSGCNSINPRGAKVRPAVVLLDTGDDDFVVAPITSHFRSSAFDIRLIEWRAAGLNTESFVRVHKLTVLPKSDIVRVIGILMENDRRQLIELLRSAFCLGES